MISDYFSKVKSNALAALQKISESVGIDQGVIISAKKDEIDPKADPQLRLTLLFQRICRTLDSIGDMENSHTLLGDRLLYQSNVREDMKAIITILQIESDKWLSCYSLSPDPEMSQLPCLNSFLQNKIMNELCERAHADHPRGTLPLILGAFASLLRRVRYPLLPHQTVHRPIVKLINIASRRDNRMKVNDRDGQSKQDILSYRGRVEAGLIALICICMRKIAENPNLLDFFAAFDSSLPAHVLVTDSPRKRRPCQVEIISTLVPLIYKNNIGNQAKEALIIALSMNDERMNTFIQQHTNLLVAAVNDIIKGYQITYELLLSMSRSPQNSHKPLLLHLTYPYAKSNKYLQYNKMRTEAGTVGSKDSTAESTLQSHLEVFVLALRFCNAITKATKSVATGDRADHDSPTIREQIKELYTTHFLHGCVSETVVALAEQQILASNVLLRRLLIELSVGSNDNYLLGITTEFLCQHSKATGESDATKDNSLGQAMISRAAGAVSQTVVVSSINYLTQFLSSAPLMHAWSLIRKVNASSTVSAATEFTSLSLILDLHSIDEKLNKLCDLAINTLPDAPEAPEATASGGRKSIGSKVVSSFLTEKQLVDIATEGILARLSGDLNAFLTFGIDSDADPQRDDLEPPQQRALSGGSLFILIHKKLTTFLTLSFEEQVALRGLLEHFTRVLCALLITSSGTNSINGYDSHILNGMIEVLMLVEALWKDIQRHLTEAMSEWETKLSALRHVLTYTALLVDNQSKQSLNSEFKMDLKKYKLVLNEPQQSRRILESAAIVLDMLCDIKASLHAMKSLRKEAKSLVNSVRNASSDLDTTFALNTPSPDNFMSPFSDDAYRNGYDSDDFEEEEASKTVHNDILLDLPSPEQVSLLRSDLDSNEASFLQEFAQLEKDFNEIIS